MFMSVDPYRSVPQAFHPPPRKRIVEWCAIAATCVIAGLRELLIPAGHPASPILVAILGAGSAIGAGMALYAYCRTPLKTG